jgi:crossover junction endodeoxyribonuclease RuvC
VKVLGIDPGTAVLGYGVVEGGPGRQPRLIECGTLTTRPRDPLPARLRILYDGISGLLDRHTPAWVAVEGAFYGRNVRTAVVLSHARGVILLAAEMGGVSVAEYSPALIKKTIVGRGAALKPQVGYMLAQLLRLQSPPEPDDAADGVAVALTHVLRATREAAFTHRPAGRG